MCPSARGAVPRRSRQMGVRVWSAHQRRVGHRWVGRRGGGCCWSWVGAAWVPGCAARWRSLCVVTELVRGCLPANGRSAHGQCVQEDVVLVVAGGVVERTAAGHQEQPRRNGLGCYAARGCSPSCQPCRWCHRHTRPDRRLAPPRPDHRCDHPGVLSGPSASTCGMPPPPPSTGQLALPGLGLPHSARPRPQPRPFLCPVRPHRPAPTTAAAEVGWSPPDHW